MILVTGATGNVGSELVPQLVEVGANVRVLIRHSSQASRFSPHVEPVRGDLDDAKSLLAAMEGVRAVYVIAFQTSQI
jgi:uncharacterized protein YbjT (DUF2867 family)